MPTTVFFKKDKNGDFEYIEISGHAGFADEGKDIVCSAISAITNGSINFLKVNYRKICKVFCNSAKIVIYLERKNYDCQLSLCMMMFQLKNIADHYPNYLKIVKKKII